MRLNKELSRAYEQYKKTYDTAEANLKKQGLTMAIKKLKVKEFKSLFERLKLEKGIAVTNGTQSYNIGRAIVADQKFEYTQKQFSKILKAMKELQKSEGMFPGIKINTEWLKHNFNEAKKILKDMYESLKKVGVSSADAKTYISEYIFGST